MLSLLVKSFSSKTRAALKVPRLVEISLSRCDLDLWSIDLKINRCLPYLISNNWYKFQWKDIMAFSSYAQISDERNDGNPNSLVPRFRRKAGDKKNLSTGLLKLLHFYKLMQFTCSHFHNLFSRSRSSILTGKYPHRLGLQASWTNLSFYYKQLVYWYWLWWSFSMFIGGHTNCEW